MDAPKIDGRTLADLLEYFTKLAGHINFYDKELAIGDWQVFFNKSIPFNLASISKYNSASIEEKLDLYKTLFNKRPGKNTLQLLVHYMYYNTIYRINAWHETVRGSGLPFENIIRNLVQDRLMEPVSNFIKLANSAGREHCIRGVDFSVLTKTDSIWNLDAGDLLALDTSIRPRRGRRKRLAGFLDAFMAIWPSFIEGIKLLSSAAADSIDDSLFLQKDELKQQHTPHIALMVAFLKLFQHLQSDLNSFTRKHLDFFFKDVLRLVARPAESDKAHIVFEIQKQLSSYLLAKGLQVKDAKDKNNQEIIFALDDEIVVNKAQVEDVRTLFLNQQPAHDDIDLTLVEGVYMAPVANKADGLTKDFAEAAPKNWPTLGAQFSRFTDVGNTTPELYPYARIGFVLASPVLLLNEGIRTVTIQLLCKVAPNCTDTQDLIRTPAIFAKLAAAMGETYYIVTKKLIAQAQKKGVSKDTITELTALLPEMETDQCCPDAQTPRKDKVQMTLIEWNNNFFTNIQSNRATEVTILQEIFKPHRVFKIAFSGKTAWIEPSTIDIMSIGTSGADFLITVAVRLQPDKPAITYFDAAALKEDLATKLPVVKIELDNEITLEYDPNPQAATNRCCFENCLSTETQYIALYQLFRDLSITGGTAPNNTGIVVNVCGLKNFVVQNDTNLMNVNAPIYTFGTRPNIVDFNVVNPAKGYCITPQFILDATAAGVSAFTINYMQGLLGTAVRYRIGITPEELDAFFAPVSAADKLILEGLFANPAKNYCGLNLTGPAFYIGSHEIFCKNWGKAWINLNWKDKPNNFNDYYKAYVLRESGGNKIYGLNERDFQVNLAVLQDGRWNLEHNGTNPRVTLNPLTAHFNRELFKDDRIAGTTNTCADVNPVQQVIEIDSRFFNVANTFKPFTEAASYTVDAANGFFRMTLENQDFMHDEYAFVLARQMMALGRLPDVALEGAIYLEHSTNNIITFKGSIVLIKEVLEDFSDIVTQAGIANAEVQNIINALNAATTAGSDGGAAVTLAEIPAIVAQIQTIRASDSANVLEGQITGLLAKLQLLESIFSFFDIDGKVLKPLEVLIPNEPWTPVLKDITLDYTASAAITDMELIHLYPYENTHKDVNINLLPALFPTHCDEGTLFIGLKELVPGNNVSLLFQLAEATANSEASRAKIVWHYLVANEWKILRDGFEVLEDATNGLTTSGIVKLAIPGNITIDNTILSKTLHWIKVSAFRDVISVSETIGIHAQAVRATFVNTPAHDQLRLNAALEPNKLSKLLEADSNVKKTAQPYESFGARVPEAEGNFYIRVSEWLHHKGRAIQKFDYERLVLDAFPEIFKVKCINHDFKLNALLYRTDVNAAPGYVMVAVIPDLNKLKSGQSFEPKAPLSVLEKITAYLKKRTSPFARIKVVNPRYEKIDLCITVQLIKGKDKVFYRKKLEDDLRLFLAPWAIGEFEKLSFGQCVNRSDIVRFIEGRDYVDYIICLNMRFEKDCAEGKTDELNEVCPLTPRSILVGGSIDVCIPESDCERWGDEATRCSKEFDVVELCKPVVVPVNG